VIPYLQVQPLHLGFFTFHPFRTLVTVGVLVGYFTMLRRARRAGLDAGSAAGAGAWLLISGFVGAHWFKLVYQPQRLAADPWAFLRFLDGIASFGGIALAYPVAAFYLWRRRTPAREIWRYLDVLAYSVLCGMMFGRVGCFLVHDHPGIHTASWLAVRYPDGPRYDLALLELIAIPFILALFHVVTHFGWPAGCYFGPGLALYAAFRLWLDTQDAYPTRYAGISVDRYASVACILAGLIIWRAVTARRSGTEHSTTAVSSGRP